MQLSYWEARVRHWDLSAPLPPVQCVGTTTIRTKDTICSTIRELLEYHVTNCAPSDLQ